MKLRTNFVQDKLKEIDTEIKLSNDSSYKINSLFSSGWIMLKKQRVKNVRFFFKKQRTQQFPKGNQFCVSVMLRLNTNREKCLYNSKGWHSYLPSFCQFKCAQALLPENELFFPDFFSISLKRRPFNLSSQPTPALFIFQISVP